MSIWVTGDMHRSHDIGKLRSISPNDRKAMTKDDYMVICGDFGSVWDGTFEDDVWLNFHDRQPWTTLFVDGNHENFDLLKKYPIIEKFGGLVQQIRPSVFHLMRGEIYIIDGATCFTMGGATSQDKDYRIPGISWWPEEMPSHDELLNAAAMLLACDYDVDYVFSHCAPTSIARRIKAWYSPDQLTEWFEKLTSDLKYKHWYFGHYHTDLDVDKRHTALYQLVTRIQ